MVYRYISNKIIILKVICILIFSTTISDLLLIKPPSVLNILNLEYCFIQIHFSFHCMLLLERETKRTK